MAAGLNIFDKDGNLKISTNSVILKPLGTFKTICRKTESGLNTAYGYFDDERVRNSKSVWILLLNGNCDGKSIDNTMFFPTFNSLYISIAEANKHAFCWYYEPDPVNDETQSKHRDASKQVILSYMYGIL